MARVNNVGTFGETIASGITRDISFRVMIHFRDDDKIELWDRRKKKHLKVYFSLTCCGRQVRLKKLSKHLMLVHLHLLLVLRSLTSSWASIITLFRYRLFAARIRSSSRPCVIRSRSITESESNYDDARHVLNEKYSKIIIRYTKKMEKSRGHSRVDPRCSPRVRRLMRGILSWGDAGCWRVAPPHFSTYIYPEANRSIKDKNLDSFSKIEERQDV